MPEKLKIIPLGGMHEIGKNLYVYEYGGDIIVVDCGMIPTVFTSNLPIEEMAVVFDARLYDRMRDMCAVLHFNGESKRGRR
jgi:DNA replication protein DnaC